MDTWGNVVTLLLTETKELHQLITLLYGIERRRDIECGVSGAPLPRISLHRAVMKIAEVVGMEGYCKKELTYDERRGVDFLLTEIDHVKTSIALYLSQHRVRQPANMMSEHL